MTGGSLVLILLAALGGLVILGLGFFAFTRFADAGASALPMPAGFREGEGMPWRRGTLRFDQDRLALRGPGGLDVGPWLRGNLDLGVAGGVDGQSARELGREGLVQVPVRYGTANFDLALDEEHYTALRSWVEAVPPGWNHPRGA